MSDPSNSQTVQAETGETDGQQTETFTVADGTKVTVEEPVPAAAQPTLTAQSALDAWMAAYVHNTPLSANTDTYNRIFAAFSQLRGLVG